MSFMREILKLIESLQSTENEANQKSPLKDLGFISCASADHIKHVPFYDPCVV